MIMELLLFDQRQFNLALKELKEEIFLNINESNHIFYIKLVWYALP